MKKVYVAFLLLAIVALSVIGVYSNKPLENTEYLRIHIRADSNEEVAQGVKYKVKSAVVEFLTPYILEATSKEDAISLLNSKKDLIKQVSDDVLKKNGFGYGSKVSIKKEEFPTRVYDEVTLPAGVYDAIIIELGSGKGDNWWCVVYPPLCFKGQEVKYIYKSKIKEIIDNFFKKESK